MAIATSATWRRDGVARTRLEPIPVDGGMAVYTPDDLMDGRLPAGERIVLCDDDHYYMGGTQAVPARAPTDGP